MTHLDPSTLQTMKTQSILIVCALSSIAMCKVHASEDQHTLFQTRMWTDRNITNPALSVPGSTINQSIERFWNLPERPLPEASPVAYSPQPPCRANTHHNHRGGCVANTSSPVPPHRDHLAQQQSNNQRRGFLGINLFNIIPIVDIVYGKAESSSSDHVNSYK